MRSNTGLEYSPRQTDSPNTRNKLYSISNKMSIGISSLWYPQQNQSHFQISSEDTMHHSIHNCPNSSLPGTHDVSSCMKNKLNMSSPSPQHSSLSTRKSSPIKPSLPECFPLSPRSPIIHPNNSIVYPYAKEKQVQEVSLKVLLVFSQPLEVHHGFRL
jgi:hypothetical protein